jgi:hypothetical protein
LRRVLLASAAAITAFSAGSALVRGAYSDEGGQQEFEKLVEQNARKMMEEGRHTFRFDTFGDEAFWEILSSSIRRLRAPDWEAWVRE